MRVSVDAALCIGCGICEGIDPEVFSLANSPTAEVIMDPVTGAHQATSREAAEACPTAAISIDEDGTEEASLETQAGPPAEETTADPGTPPWPAAEETQTNNHNERIEEMRAIVDQDLCIGCGICEGIAPEIFSLQTEPYAVVIMDPITGEFQAAAQESADECPEGAITIEK